MKNESQNLKTTPLYEIQKQKAKKFAEFAGWYMPIAYTDANEEHLAVRNSCGIFDISHMGLIHIRGAKSPRVLNYYFTTDVSKMAPNEIKYGFFLNKNGGVIEDLMIYKKTDISFVLCVNASNTKRVYELFAPFISPAFNIFELTPKIMFSLTGPKAEEIMQNIVMPELGLGGNYRLPERKKCIFANNLIIARVGYTGEDGFEISGPTEENNIIQPYCDLKKLWRLFDEDPRVKPCGLAARDSLRLEAGLPLYGDELTKETTPLEAGLSKFVDFSKENFLGKAALLRQTETGISKCRIGFVIIEKKGMPFGGSIIIFEEKEIGFITSSVKLPDGKIIGMGYIKEILAPETEIMIAAKEKIGKAKIIKLPFLAKRNK